MHIVRAWCEYVAGQGDHLQGLSQSSRTIHVVAPPGREATDINFPDDVECLVISIRGGRRIFFNRIRLISTFYYATRVGRFADDNSSILSTIDFSLLSYITN